MERHNIRRATQIAASTDSPRLWRDDDRCRYRPARRPVAFTRPREEQTWPTPLVVRAAPPRMTPNDAHPDWPGRKRPAVPLYQRRLDRHTDGIVRSFHSHPDGRTMAGRRRGLTTHRRPLAVVRETLALGRGTDLHDERMFAGPPVVYWRLRTGGGLFDGVVRGHAAIGAGLRGSALLSPRHAVIAMVAVVVLLMGAMGTGLAQERYVVRDGDTINSIAVAFGVDPEALAPVPNAHGFIGEVLYSQVHVSDPATGSLDFHPWDEFIELWKVIDGMSMAVYPA